MYDSLHSLHTDIHRIFTTTHNKPYLRDKRALQDTVIDTLVKTAVFAKDTRLKNEARAWIRNAAFACNIASKSIAPLYLAFGKESIRGFTTPAINLRTLTYDLAGIILQTAMEKGVGALIFEIARSEIAYTEQSPDEYATIILAAAVKQNFTGPIFLQGDHFQVSLKHWQQNPEEEITSLKTLITDAIRAGFCNIDIDASTLVDLTKQSLYEQQQQNAKVTADLIRHIRSLERPSDPLSIGAEIGHIGGRVSTVSDFEAFMDHLGEANQQDTITKISVQTGTQHGGNILSDGTIAAMTVDFETLNAIGVIARKKYGVGGAVQHGASTLPLSLFSQFVASQTLEIHLSTAFQNMVFTHIPETLRLRIHAWIETYCKDERHTDWSDEQFFYRTRKKALGSFKKDLWELSPEQKEPILANAQTYISGLFDALQVTNTIDTVSRFIKV